MAVEQEHAPDPVEIDVHLLHGVARGDQADFAKLFDRHGAAVLGLLTRMLGGRSDAEEVLQETFLQVWQRAEDYRAERASPKTWIFLLARSRALDRLRRRGASARRDAAVREERSDAGPLVGIEAVESRVVVRHALATLTPEQRECIELSFFHGLSLAQIADRSKTPLGTVKSRFLYGMRKLRDHLGVRS